MEQPTIFKDNDEGYLEWIENNKNGFVINAFRKTSDLPVMIHKATCRTIRVPSAISKPHWTTGDSIKICSLDKTNLETWGNNNFSGKVQICTKCNP